MGLILFFLVLVLVQPWPLFQFQFHRGRPVAVDTVFYWKNFFYKPEKKYFSDEWLCFFFMSVLIIIKADSLIVTNLRNGGKVS